MRNMVSMRNGMDLLRCNLRSNVKDKVHNELYRKIDVKVFGRGQIPEQVCNIVFRQIKTNLKVKV
jgi:hypothetical protein